MLNLVQISAIEGLQRCSRYSFGPNRLHYCGPDANAELLAYIQNKTTDKGLENIIKKFATLYPYLKLISRANNIEDPFNDRVVQAYWIGNELLENVALQELHRNLIEDHQIKKKIGLKSFFRLENKIKQQAVPHHSFHVLNIWRRTGHLDEAQTLFSMDSCRISWGKITKIDGPHITIKTKPLIEQNSKLALGSEIEKRVTRFLESNLEIDSLKENDIITAHWGVPCEKISLNQAQNLEKYTLQSIDLCNNF